MLNRLFGNYLIEKKILIQDQLNDFLPVPKDLKAEIETIAVITKALTAEDAISILSQIDKSKQRFGDVAVESDYLSDDKLDYLLTYQSNDFMKFSQILFDNNIISLDQIVPLLNEFQIQSEFSDSQMNSLIHDDLEQCVSIFVPLKSPQLKDLAITTVQTLRKIIDRDVYLEKAYAARSFQLDSYASQMIVGDMRINVYFTGAGNSLLGIANHFTGDTYSEICSDALDNVSEFINCINGQFATNLSYENISVDMNSPEYSLEGVLLSNQKLFVIPVNANVYNFKVVLEVYSD